MKTKGISVLGYTLLIILIQVTPRCPQAASSHPQKFDADSTFGLCGSNYIYILQNSFGQ